MELPGKNIVVVGMARTGIATARFLREHGARVTVSEAQPAAQLPAEALALAQQGILLETYEINRLVTDTTIKSTSQAVMNAFNNVVLYERHVNAYADVHGITIYHISKASEKDSNYTYYRATLDFALQTGWDEFLNDYVR